MCHHIIPRIFAWVFKITDCVVSCFSFFCFQQTLGYKAISDSRWISSSNPSFCLLWKFSHFYISHMMLWTSVECFMCLSSIKLCCASMHELSYMWVLFYVFSNSELMVENVKHNESCIYRDCDWLLLLVSKLLIDTRPCFEGFMHFSIFMLTNVWSSGNGLGHLPTLKLKTTKFSYTPLYYSVVYVKTWVQMYTRSQNVRPGVVRSS